MVFWNKKNSVKIEMVHKQNTENKDIIEFWFKLNKDILGLTVNINSLNQKDKIKPLPDTSYYQNKWYLLAGYENVKVKQKWKFTFKGFKKENNEEFKSVINYKI